MNTDYKEASSEDLEIISGQLFFLASIINDKPSEEFISRLRSYYSNLPYNTERDDMAEFLKETEGKPDSVIAEGLAIEWTRLFRGVSPLYGPRPPYAGIFISKDGSGLGVISELQKLYDKYEFKRNPNKPDRGDYLACIMDFTSYLVKKAVISKNNSNEYLEVARKCLNDYVSPWVKVFTNEAAEYADSLFFKGYLPLLSDYLVFTSETLGED